MNKLWFLLIFWTILGVQKGNSQAVESSAPARHLSHFERISSDANEWVLSNYPEYFQSAHGLVKTYAIESPSGYHFTYSHKLFGKEVLNSDLKIHYSKDGELIHIQNLLSPVAKHREYYFIPDNAVFVLKDGEYQMAFKGEGGSTEHPTFTIDLNGERLEENDQKLYFRGPDSLVRAKVFLVNPINSAAVDYGGLYIDNKDSNSAVLTQELKEVKMRVNFRNDTFFLGDSRFHFKNVIDPNTSPVFSLTDTFFFNRSDVEFEDVNAFYHLSNYAAYVDSMGYKALLFDTLVVDGNAGTGDFSAFDPNPTPKTLEFGLGGVDDAEDGEVVIHEMVHSLSTKASPSTVKGNDRMAMEEGNCDYLASSYSKSYSSHNVHKVFSWDGHNEFWGGFVNNSSKNYKTDRTGFRDQDREIWSSALMCIEEKLGRRTTDSLVFEHLFYQAKNMSMPQMAMVMLKMDTMQNKGANIWEIRQCFVQRGILEPLGFEDIALNPSILVKNTKAFASCLEPLEIEFAHPGDRTIRLVSTSGKILRTHQSRGTEFSLSPTNLSPGLYILSVEGPERFFQTKLRKF